MVWFQKADMKSWVKLKSLKQLQYVSHLPHPFYYLKRPIIFRN